MADLIITGLEDVEARLKAIPVELRKGPVQRATLAGARMMREKVRAAVPQWNGAPLSGGRQPGLLKQSIAVFTDRKAPPGVIRYLIGTRRLKKSYVNNAKNRRYYRVGKKYFVPGAGYYIKFVEFGSRSAGPKQPKTHARKGQGAQHPFANTVEANAQAFIDTFTTTLETQLTATIKKLNPAGGVNVT